MGIGVNELAYNLINHRSPRLLNKASILFIRQKTIQEVVDILVPQDLLNKGIITDKDVLVLRRALDHLKMLMDHPEICYACKSAGFTSNDYSTTCVYCGAKHRWN